ncbi:MAG: HAMP domain-containing protein [Ramlibacter sp.]|nr:HAMP domain-containing protein [Ramlibacter sp.]
MFKNTTADTFLNLLVYSLLLGVAAFGGLSYYAFQQSNTRTTEALQTGRALGTAVASARAADQTLRDQAGALEQLVARGANALGRTQRPELQRELQRAQQLLGDARQALARHGVDVAALDGGSAQLQSLLQQLDAGARPPVKPTRAQPAGSKPAGDLPAFKWADVAPGVEAAVQARGEQIATASAQRTRQVGIWVSLLFLLGLVLTWRLRNWMLRANGRPLRVATHLVERVSAGDLTVQVEGMTQAHVRKLAGALDDMTSSLRAVISEVADRARTVADTSSQIAQGNLDLSQRTEEQASTLEETASSMEELTSTVAHNADNARQASQLAASASETAQQGGDVVEEVVKTMDEILDASKKIGDIISVIDGIAFQTNILALNAAVEAARAGDQGRGFAVVAAEVRNLAHRTTAAAKEIKGLIAHAEQKVQAGSSRVDEAGHTMVGVVLSVKKVSSLIAEIAAASREQSAGIGQVNTAVAQMEQVVQQNASLVEEATAATESMKDQAAALLQAMSRFKLQADEGDGDEGREPVRMASVTPMAPPPIQVKAPSPALPPSQAPAIAAASRKPGAQNGQWEEF